MATFSRRAATVCFLASRRDCKCCVIVIPIVSCGRPLVILVCWVLVYLFLLATKGKNDAKLLPSAIKRVFSKTTVNILLAIINMVCNEMLTQQPRYDFHMYVQFFTGKILFTVR